MHKLLKSAAVLSLVLLAVSLTPRKRTLCDGFLPPNNMRIPVGDIRALGITEASFNAVLDRVQKVYGPVIAKKGGKLVINRLWRDATVNASAEQYGDQWIINMYGGLARHKTVTADGFALVACHELGHHIGGHPKIGGEWATNEGGADYFATLKCLRNILPIKTRAVDPVAAKACAAAYPDGGGKSCEDGTMAGVSVSSLLAELGRSPKPSLTTPDESVVDQMDDNHPAAQCRLDTYFQGALCTRKTSEDVSDSDPSAGACTAPAYTQGLRPLCWYKPPTAVAIPAPMLVSRPMGDVKTIEADLEALKDALSGNGI